MKFLIVGKDGQLGGEFMRLLGERYEITGLSRNDVNIQDAKSISAALRKYKPDMLINTAAFTDIEKSEENPGEAFAVNASAAGIMAVCTAKEKIPLVHFSSDYVFDGKKKFYNENDGPNPLNVYGVSKWQGEKLVASANPQHYIIRTSSVFGGESKRLKFVSIMRKLARERKKIRCISDQYMSPTYSVDLVNTIIELIKTKAKYGIYHITNSGETSWYEFARKIFAITGQKADLQPILLEEYGFKTKRPQRSVLVSNKLEELGIKKLRLWEEALKEYLFDK